MGAMSDAADTDVTRRTHLAAERTWLAWWRTGIATATAAVGVGGVAPKLVGGSTVPYVVLGAGYALLAAAIFGLAGRRQADVDRALQRGDYVGLASHWVVGFTFVGVLLTLGSLVAILVNA
jgi:inner membrane protein YidH